MGDGDAKPRCPALDLYCRNSAQPDCTCDVPALDLGVGMAWPFAYDPRYRFDGITFDRPADCAAHSSARRLDAVALAKVGANHDDKRKDNETTKAQQVQFSFR